MKPQIRYLTHASLFFEGLPKTFMTDPFFVLDPLLKQSLMFYPPHEFNPKELGRIDYIYCSHNHDDHSHRETLLTIKPQVGLIILPAGKRDLELKIRSMGFDHILLIEPEKTVQLDGDYKITPFFDSNGFDTALIIEIKGKTILHQNDCRLDESTFERIAERFKIDFAFVPHTDFNELYPQLLSYDFPDMEKLCEQRESLEVDFRMESIERLNPKYVFPYAYSLAYISRSQSWRNSLRVMTPPVFCRELVKRYPDLSAHAIEPGDQIELDSEKVISINALSYWGEDREDYLLKLQQEIDSVYGGELIFQSGNLKDVQQSWEKYLQERVQRSFPPELGGQLFAVRIMGDDASCRYVIDVENKTFEQDYDAFVVLELTTSPTVIQECLKGEYDPCMILYSFEVEFQWNLAGLFSDKKLCELYILVFMSLFDEERYAFLTQGV